MRSKNRSCRLLPGLWVYCDLKESDFLCDIISKESIGHQNRLMFCALLDIIHPGIQAICYFWKKQKIIERLGIADV